MLVRKIQFLYSIVWFEKSVERLPGKGSATDGWIRVEVVP
jgi:hypothetical protein